MAELQAHAMLASLALPRRGAEAGGLLLGEIDPYNPRILRVTAFEEIICEHRYGPAFVLSDADRARLAEALERPDRPSRVVGLYRSFTGREPVLDAADEDLIRTFFRDPRLAFLLIEPEGAAAECSAAFLFWNRDDLPDKPPYPRFRLDPEKMRRDTEVPAPPAEDPGHGTAESPPALPAEIPFATAVAAATAPPAPLPPETLPPPSFAATRWRAQEDEPEEPVRRRSPLWLVLLACILLGGGGAFVYELWKLARAPRWTELRLDAERTPSGLELNWDREAPAVLEASSGILVVTDGPVRQSIALPPADIRAGRFSYVPLHNDISFRLELFDGPLASSGDSLRVLSLAANRPTAPPAPAAAPATAAPPAHLPEPAAAPHKNVAEREEPASAASPPVALHEVQPGLSSGILARIHGRIVIPVEVTVSASGKVTRALAETDGDSLYQYLADKAERAARLWKFAPARSRSGKRVAGTKTLYFVFTKPA